MAVAPPPQVPSGVLQRVRSDMRSQRAARGRWPPGELSFSPRRTREFEREPLPLLLRSHERHGPVFTLLGDGLLTTDGDYHRRARRIMLPAFHREQLAASTSIMVEEAERAVSAWRPGERVDLYAWTRPLGPPVATPGLFGFRKDP